MKSIVNLAVRTEFSFRQTFGKLNSDFIDSFRFGQGWFGTADINNTFSHVHLQKECQALQKKGINVKPIFGVRLEVLKDPLARQRGISGPVYLFIAKNQSGLQEINKLTKIAWDNFYYKPMIGWDDVNELSEDVFVISDNVQSLDVRLDYLALTPSTPIMMLDALKKTPRVYINNNFFPRPEDRKVYQLIAGAQKRADGYYYKFETKRAFQHILDSDEFYRIWKSKAAIENTHFIAEQCDFELPKAKMVKYSGKNNIITLCKQGARKKGIDLEQGEYAERYEREMELIFKKDYVDYFLIVADMIAKAKKKMFVGPARGSAAGSLVCYLIGITEVDPIKFDLLFERFIDINRNDLPDIDVDFPDEMRPAVIKDLFKTHGKDNVCHIANINEYAARSSIDEVGIALRIPKFEVDILKDSIVDRSGGDARAKMSVQDTLDGTDVGKSFMQKYPAMKYAGAIQTHATHMGKHAAGIIVCNDEITKFGGVNSREGSIMMDKKGAEYLNLLKIDCLGLRNLTILQECAELIGMNYLDYYDLPLDDEKTYGIFREMRLNGIFQFEGQAMRLLCSKMGVENFNDIVVITALARPGPLQSGGADKFTKRRIGLEEVEYISSHPEFIKCTKDTYGIIVYQEQLMYLCRTCGNMSWEDVSEIRKAASKTLGKEFFDQYREKFLTGAKENNINDSEAITMWENMMTFGSWGMNKSHTVSYGYISYWCAYMKANHPLEYVLANLRHSSSNEAALKILRDAFENDGIEYVPIDPDTSELDWSIQNGKLVGGLKNIDGIGPKKALEILECRAGKKNFTPGLVAKLMNPKTPFDTIYPCKDKWGDIYDNPRNYGLNFSPSFIKDVDKVGTYVVIGRVMRRDLRDLNEYNELVKRGGKVYKENNKSLKLTIEDDTGQINCSISRFKFDEVSGMKLSETLIEGESWVIIRGELREGWRVIHIEQIFDLKEL